MDLSDTLQKIRQPHGEEPDMWYKQNGFVFLASSQAGSLAAAL